MKAIWDMDYDYRTDETYNRPCCPECREPIGRDEDGKYYCFSCGGEVEVTDPEMLDWLTAREETKVEIGDDPIIKGRDRTGREITTGCGGKNCVEKHYFKNHVTLNWQLGWSVCRNCGARIIV